MATERTFIATTQNKDCTNLWLVTRLPAYASLQTLWRKEMPRSGNLPTPMNSPCPMFDSFYNGSGGDAIKNYEFWLQASWGALKSFPGLCCAYLKCWTRLGMFCIWEGCIFYHDMCAEKQWDVLDSWLKIMAPKFERLVTRFVQFLSPFLYRNWSLTYVMSTVLEKF